MSITPNLGLYAWESEDDPYSHTQLSANSFILDAHDHTEGRGKRIKTEAIVDRAITTVKLADGAVTAPKYAPASIPTSAYQPGSVDATAIKDLAVGTAELADRSVTAVKLAEGIRYLGELSFFWRPTTALPIPDGWEVADGRTLTGAEHDFPGGGNVTLPDLRNKFVLGAATGGTGTASNVPPAIGQTGGTNAANLAHSHVVDPHVHGTVPHSHTVAAHTHTVASHRHQVDPHSHTVNAHGHTVPGHTHPIPDHSHSISHVHFVLPHSHSIVADGAHQHTVAGGFTMHQRPYDPSEATDARRQALYAAGYNSGGTDATAGIDIAGGHSHGGSTGNQGAGTTDSNNPNSGGWSGNTNANGNFQTADASPGTSNASPFTSMESPLTSAASPSTDAVAPNTLAASATTSTALGGTTDIRPAYVGALVLIKVRR
jgi:hypothetical protein